MASEPKFKTGQIAVTIYGNVVQLYVMSNGDLCETHGNFMTAIPKENIYGIVKKIPGREFKR